MPVDRQKNYMLTDVEVLIDLTMSSSPELEPINVDALSVSPRPNTCSSSPISYGSDDENQVCITDY